MQRINSEQDIHLSSFARMDESGDEEDLLERAVGDGDIQSELAIRSAYDVLPSLKKSRPVVQGRHHTLPLPYTSKTKTRLSELRDQPKHLAAHPGTTRLQHSSFPR